MNVNRLASDSFNKGGTYSVIFPHVTGQTAEDVHIHFCKLCKKTKIQHLSQNLLTIASPSQT